MKVPTAPHSPPLPVLVITAVAILILFLLIAKTLSSLLVAIIQLGVILVALGGVIWAGLYLLRRVQP